MTEPTAPVPPPDGRAEPPPRLRYGQYEVELPPLGEGGFGVVYKARHLVLRRTHCIKVLLAEYTRNRDVVARFVNEALAVASLRHPHIINVYDCAQTEDGVWFIVLEYLAGVNLSDWLDGRVAHGVTPPAGQPGAPHAVGLDQLVRILGQTASALHAAHVAGIVHRDVKPDNIFLVAHQSAGRLDGHRAILLDFGIAKLLDSNLTRTGTGIGTPAYMAPEQLANAKEVDLRADVYALGAIAFKMLTGRHVWANEAGDLISPSEIYRRQTTEAPPDPRLWNPGIDPRLAQAIRRALACSPSERWSNALEFIRAVAETVEPDGIKPGGETILETWAPDVWNCADPLWGRRTVVPPAPSSGDGGWTPPPTAVSISSELAGAPILRDATTRPLRPPPVVPSAAIQAAQTGETVSTLAPTATSPGGWSRRRLVGVLAAGTAALVVVIAVAIGADGGAAGAGHDPATPAARAIADAGLGPAETSPPATSATTSVAVLTTPPGAAVFVDGELMDEQAPAKLALEPGRAVRIRAELPGYDAAETSHTVSATAETVRLTLAPIVAAAPAIDAGLDAAARNAAATRRLSPPGTRAASSPSEPPVTTPAAEPPGTRPVTTDDIAQ